jgi:hypothetical protein
VSKVHNKPIKRPKMGSYKKSKGQPKCSLVWRTGLSGVPPDSVRCTRGLQAELITFGNSQRRVAIIHRTVRCTTGQCPVPHGRAALNSPASGIRSAIIHRTCPVSQRSNGYYARNGRLQRIKCAPARAEDRARAGGTPDSLQDLSGAPPDSQAGPQDRAPTVGTQRPGDVAGAPDSVRWRTGLSGAPCDRSLHQTASLVVGVINTLNHPTFKSSKFSHFYTLQEL